MSEKTPERLALESRAIDLGVTFQANIGDAKLEQRVADAEAERDKDKPPLVGTGGAADDGSRPPAGVEDAPAVNPPAINPPAPPVTENVRALVLGRLDHDGKTCEVDEYVTLTVPQFEALEAAGVVTLAVCD